MPWWKDGIAVVQGVACDSYSAGAFFVAKIRGICAHAEGVKALRNHLYWSSESLAEGFGGEVSPHIFNRARAESGRHNTIGKKAAKE